MGLAKGTFSFTRYRIKDHLNQDGHSLAQLLQRQAFFHHADKTGDKISGWSLLDHPLEKEFQDQHLICGDYLVFSLRTDTRQVAPSLLKIRTLEAAQALAREKGLRRLPKALHNDLREEVAAKLKRQAHPVPAIIDICWDVNGQVIWFGSLADKNLADFENLFKETFGIIPGPYLPQGPEDRLKSAQATTNDSLFQETSSQASSPAGEIITRRKFLTWLYLNQGERNGLFDLADGRTIQVILNDRLVLTAGEGEYTETLVCQGRYSDHEEVRLGLKKGKMICEARIEIHHDATAWKFTLKADGMQFQSLKLPSQLEPEDKDDPEGHLLERIHLLEQLTGMVDELYESFSRRRHLP
jgi:recombination associated protein RdgC